MVQSVLVKDVFETYSYFCIDEDTGHGFLIDPGAEADKLLKIIKDNGWTIERILLTHGHFDHTGAVEEISNTLRIPYIIHQNGEQYLYHTEYNLSAYCNRHVILKDAKYISDQDKITLNDAPEYSLQVIYTPGHTTDSVVFYSVKEHFAFVWDTIFRGNVGSTQYPGGDIRSLQDSILNRIFHLPGDTVLYSGHSDPTTVTTERNRYVTQA